MTERKWGEKALHQYLTHLREAERAPATIQKYERAIRSFSAWASANGAGIAKGTVIRYKEYLLERPIRADIACIYGSVADKYGNVKIHGTARNFNTVMAAAADTVICQADEVVEMIDPDEVLIQGVLVDYIVGGKN